MSSVLEPALAKQASSLHSRQRRSIAWSRMPDLFLRGLVTLLAPVHPGAMACILTNAATSFGSERLCSWKRIDDYKKTPARQRAGALFNSQPEFRRGSTRSAVFQFNITLAQKPREFLNSEVRENFAFEVESRRFRLT